MNRVIKFRAWNKMVRAMLRTDSWINNHDDFYLENLNATFNIDDMVFMQFTGLLDKNGKEIFEGDIVQVFYHEKPQIDENKAYTVVIEDIRKGFFGVGEGHGEVIGNIYENPELLKV